MPGKIRYNLLKNHSQYHISTKDCNKLSFRFRLCASWCLWTQYYRWLQYLYAGNDVIHSQEDTQLIRAFQQKKQLLEQCDVKRQCTATNPSYDCRRDSKMGPFMYCHCNVTMKMHMATRECVDKNWCAKDQDCIDTSLVCAHQRCVLRTSIGSKTITVTTTQTRKTSGKKSHQKPSV